MSYLYSTFAQLVSVHCKATTATSNVPVNQCKHDLLSYGYDKLQTFNDAQLDAFDPYQRGANQLSKFFFIKSFSKICGLETTLNNRSLHLYLKYIVTGV